MTQGFFGKAIRAQCYGGGQVCIPYDFMSCHIVFDTKRTTAPITEQSSLYGMKIIPPAITYGLVGYAYNTTNEHLNVATAPYGWGNDLAWWGKRTIVDGYPIEFEGPEFLRAHTVIGLHRVPYGVEPAGRRTAYFTDASPGRQVNSAGDSLGKDWLGFLNPAGYMFLPKDMPTPLLAETWFENSGFAPNLTDQFLTNYNYLPFAQPLHVFDDPSIDEDGLGGTCEKPESYAEGTRIPSPGDESKLTGRYVGLTFIPIFGECAMKNPIGPMPEEPGVPFPPGAFANPTGQFVSLDLWIYLLAVPEPGKTLKSPRIATLRGWLPRANIESDSGRNTSWCDGYQYITFPALDETNSSFAIDIDVAAAAEQTCQTRIVLSNLKVYLTA